MTTATTWTAFFLKTFALEYMVYHSTYQYVLCNLIVFVFSMSALNFFFSIDLQQEIELGNYKVVHKL